MRASSVMVITLCATTALLTGCLAKRGAGGGQGSSSTDGAGGEAGAGGAGEGATSAGGGGLGVSTCGACIDQQVAALGACEMMAAQCEAEPDCVDWWECLGDCADGDWTGACIEACDASHPAAASLVFSLETCVCGACSFDPDCAPLCS